MAQITAASNVTTAVQTVLVPRLAATPVKPLTAPLPLYAVTARRNPARHATTATLSAKPLARTARPTAVIAVVIVRTY